jgi:hypothetical protein
MADLNSGRYGQANPMWSWLGQPANVANPSVPAFSNLMSPMIGLSDQAAALATGVATAVAVPVDPGTVITKITVMVGATAESGGTHAWGALYSGIATPALLAQSTDNTGATAIGASAAFSFTLATPQLITPAIAPNGFVYASIMVAQSAGAVPSLTAISSFAAAVAYPWFTTSPLKMAAITHGSSLTGTAPATIASPAAQAVTPIVFLQ